MRQTGNQEHINCGSFFAVGASGAAALWWDKNVIFNSKIDHVKIDWTYSEHLHRDRYKKQSDAESNTQWIITQKT